MNNDDELRLATVRSVLLVEGIDEEAIIPKFLDAGTKNGHWPDWNPLFVIRNSMGSKPILSQLEEALDANDSEIWGLIDRDWRTNEEVKKLEKKFSGRLLVLPRRELQ